MPITTPKYLITAPSPSTIHKNLGLELQQMAFDIERALDTFDYNGADPSAVLARVAALEFRTRPAAQIPERPWTKADDPGGCELMNSWTNVQNVNWNGLQVCVRNGLVQLTGAITKSSAFASLETVAKLPPGLAPEVSTMVPCAYAQTGGYVLVRSSGDIVTASSGTGGQIAMAGQIVPPTV